ncbi:MAG: CCA tRNA nucleotidyltransferase [bacterium]|nr:CCA tRNA nucleotidyltransferase [bacterium]
MDIPKEVESVVATLEKAGFKAYVVGGCVRDLLLGIGPKDWDVTTSAKPEEILRLFPESFYENKFLTVTVKTDSQDYVLAEIEVTTFRAEGKYTDKRHPDEVGFAKTLEEDLARRDFTINAIALADEGPIDPFGGQEDIKKKLVRAVGTPETRFEEDALRMMRAVRLAIQLDFKIEKNTEEAIKKLAGNLEFVARERVRDELIKIIMTPKAKKGIELLHEVGLLRYIIPELEEGIGVENRPKIFYIWEHNLRALDYGAQSNFSLDVRLAALLHDVGKPRTKGEMKNNEWTFYGHDVVGAKMTAQIMDRLKFSHNQTEKICKLVRWHLFKYDVEEDAATTDSSIRRLIRKVGVENMEDLVKLRICDRMGMGVPKAVPYRLRHFQFRVEKILHEEEAPTPKMLLVDGADVMNILKIEPGPKIGRILEVLLQEIIDDPAKNIKENLESRIKNLGKLSDDELAKMAEKAESKIELVEDERVSKIKAKYYVK